MPLAFLPLRVRWGAIAIVVAAMTCTESGAIEMFTYFGDGSRIGLPSLEVPIEAYPGIPLRSDRLRARRRAMRMGPAAAQGAPRGPSQTITIRSMPEAVAAPSPRPIRSSDERSKPAPPPSNEIPVAPEPEGEAVSLPSEP